MMAATPVANKLLEDILGILVFRSTVASTLAYRIWILIFGYALKPRAPTRTPSHSWLAVFWLIFLFSSDAYASNMSDTLSGVLPGRCKIDLNRVLGDASEVDKAGSAVATTIMTLLPTLLAFAPLPTARTKAMLFFSTGAAFITSAMTFGLSTTNVSTLVKGRILRAKDLCPEAMIPFYGKTGMHSGRSTTFRPSLGNSRATFSDTTIAEDMSAIRQKSRNLGPSTTSTGEERHQYSGPLLTKEHEHDKNISMIQELYFSEKCPKDLRGLRDEALRKDQDLPLGILIVPVLPGLDITASTQLQELRDDVLRVKGRRKLWHITLYSGCFIYLQYLALLIMPWLLDLINSTNIIWLCPGMGGAVFTCWTQALAFSTGFIRTCWESFCFGKTYEIFHLSPLPHSTLEPKCRSCSIIEKDPPRQRFGDGFHQSVLMLRSALRLDHWVWFYKHFSIIVPATIILKERFGSPAAMTVVVKLSEKAYPPRDPLISMLFGFIQAMMLIFLTFLFGSTQGGDLFPTLGFLCSVVTVIVLSRAWSISFCSWMEKASGVTIIECDTVTEKEAMTRILVTMPGVVVESRTNGYKYLEGYKFGSTGCQTHTGTVPDLNPIALGRFFAFVAYLVMVVMMVVRWIKNPPILFVMCLAYQGRTLESEKQASLALWEFARSVKLIVYPLAFWSFTKEILWAFDSLSIYNICKSSKAPDPEASPVRP